MTEREIAKAINDKIDETFGREDSYGFNLQYVKWGDAVSVLINGDTITIFFEGKGYGDGCTREGDVVIYTDAEYRARTPKYFFNFRGQRDINISRNFVCNKAYRLAKELGSKVTKIHYFEQLD